MTTPLQSLPSAHHAIARVQSGSRIEVTVPGLQEGQDVDVYLIARHSEISERPRLLEFLDALPPGPRSAPTWDEVEAQLAEGRNGWDR